MAMSKKLIEFICAAAIFVAAMTAAAPQCAAQEIVRKNLYTFNPDSVEKVIVGADTVSVIIP